MKKSAAGFAALAAVCVFAAPAPAGQPQGTPTEITVEESFSVDGQNYVAGVIRSQKPKCRANRKIQFEIRAPGASKFTAFDVDRSSQRGAWSLQIPNKFQIESDFRFRAPRQKVGKSTVCAADTAPLFL